MSIAETGHTASGTVSTCAIHQPNFFPWLGYFDKIRRADVFIIMDAIAAPKEATWINRVSLDFNGVARPLTCPIRRWHGFRPVADIMINDGMPWRRKMLRSLEVHYGRARNFARVMPLARRLLAFESDRLTSFNINAIEAISRILGIRTPLVRQSELAVQGGGQGTELLIALTKAVGCSAYLCGGGASGYQDDTLFPVHGIALEYQNYRPQPYGDTASWIPGLSVIDYLMRTVDDLAWEAA